MNCLVVGLLSGSGQVQILGVVRCWTHCQTLGLHVCCQPGWPLKSGAVFAGNDVEAAQLRNDGSLHSFR